MSKKNNNNKGVQQLLTYIDSNGKVQWGTKPYEATVADKLKLTVIFKNPSNIFEMYSNAIGVLELDYLYTQQTEQGVLQAVKGSYINFKDRHTILGR